MYDRCVIGGGASGLTAAITAAEAKPGLRIVVLEKKDKPGSKILASGNGRCNMTNTECLNYRETLGFFSSLGVLARIGDEGRIYPYSEEALAVQRGLTDRAAALGIEIRTDWAAAKASKKDAFVVISSKGDSIEARCLLIACGGKAGPKFGTTGDGYGMAKGFDHHVTKLVPALTGVTVRENIKALAGVRARAKVSLIFRGSEIFEESGIVQFSGDYISGICVMNLSRFLLIPEGKSLSDGFDDYIMSIDLLPDAADVERLIVEKSQKPGISAGNLLNSIVSAPLAAYIMKFSKGDAKVAAGMLKDLKFKPSGVRGWEYAQVTRGGVELDEINMENMESELVPGLYFAGEIIDYDGPCGGYNLQNAWETGIRAGRGMADVL